MPPSGRPPAKLTQHDKVCLTTEEAKAVYECLNQDQTVSPIHFDKDLPKLHSVREGAYAKLENILEEEGPLNPYEHALLNPYNELPTKTPEILKTWRIGQSSAQRSTMLIRKVQEQIIFLYWEDKTNSSKNGYPQGMPQSWKPQISQTLHS